MTVADHRKHQIEELEKLLHKTLRPVNPRPEFARQLRQRLSEPALIIVGSPENRKTQYALLIAASLLSSTFLLLNGSRLVLAILGALGVLHYAKQQADEKQLVSSN
jgi:hypothetical protein